jgi:hypothetical protein
VVEMLDLEELEDFLHELRNDLVVKFGGEELNLLSDLIIGDFDET